MRIKGKEAVIFKLAGVQRPMPKSVKAYQMILRELDKVPINNVII